MLFALGIDQSLPRQQEHAQQAAHSHSSDQQGFPKQQECYHHGQTGVQIVESPAMKCGASPHQLHQSPAWA